MKKIVFYITFGFLLYLNLFSAVPGRIYIKNGQFYVGDKRIWINGCNTPWNNWNDFGGNYNAAWWSSHYQNIHDNYGVNASRVWITCSGEVGILIDESGYVSGATQKHWQDLDSFFQVAYEKGIYIKATLISFDHFKNSYSTYQRWRNWINSDTNIDSYINNYLIPFLNRYKDNPALWAIDLTNEPDWATTSEGGVISWDRFQVFWAKAAKAIHENSDVLVTVGMGVIKYLSDTCPGSQGNKVSDSALRAKLNDPKVYLDFWSVHYYPWMDPYWPIPMYVTPQGYYLDTTKPAVIGECPAKGSTNHTIVDDYRNAFLNGWQGVMPWTSNGVDSNGSISDMGSGTLYMKNNYYELIFPSPSSNNTLPVVSIIYPSDGQTVSGLINIQVEATDNTGISKVLFYIDDICVSTDTTSPYSYSWDTTMVSDGQHTIKAVAYNISGSSSSVSISVNVLNQTSNQNEIIIEAEDGVLNGVQVATTRSGYSGSGYVTGFDNNNDYVEVTANIPTSGVYELKIRYAAPYGYKENYLYINDQLQGAISFLESSTFTVVSCGKIFLDASQPVKLKIQSYWGWFELDCFILTKSDISSFNISKQLTIPDAIPNAKRLMSFLVDNYGKKIISGQWSSHTGSTDELDYINTTTNGKQPAIWGLDMLYYSGAAPESWRNNVPQKAIDWWKNKKGIVTMCWHWFSPKDWTDQIWNSFYSDKTNFDVRKAVQEGTEEYNLIIRDIDIIANEFKTLQNEGVPILWRPLHEASGGWFWWGKYGPEYCKQLYRIMYDRMVNYHGLKNLIWVWTITKTTQEELDWYPGDDVVDIIGYDIYAQAGDYSPMTMTFYKISEMFSNKKMITLSENGPIPDPDLLEQQKACWSWFCPWAGNYIMDGVINTTSHINKVYHHNYVITLDELPNLEEYTYEETTSTLKYYNLNVIVNPTSAGTVNKTPNNSVFVENSTVTLQAVASNGFLFSNWVVNSTSSYTSALNPLTLTITTHTTVLANFVQITTDTKTYTLNVYVFPQGAGVVNPAGGIYLEGSTVTLTAQANTGWKFSSWSGDIISTSNPLNIIIDTNKSLTAYFVLDVSTNTDALPVINNINILNNQTINGVFDLVIDCSDDKGINKVEIYIDGLLFSTLTDFPYVYNLDTNVLSNGEHNLLILVYDTANQVSDITRQFIVANEAFSILKDTYLITKETSEIKFDSIVDWIKVYNIKGDLVFEGKSKVELNNLKSGVYIYKAKTKLNGIKVGKILVIR